ncbi:MAG: DNA-directed RNA polymerase subunit alpha [bacterium]|nr:DNA-directed RNA polymerase subunit alpha [bacterium]
MENISLPERIVIESVEGSPFDARVVISPCYPGYGVTIANALRRVLLSSLPGAAITAMKARGVDHEFSAIKGVAEDVVDIVLNLKTVRLKMHEEGPVELKLNVTGIKTVTAGDIQAPSSVEIMNKDIVLFTTTDKDAKVEMILTCEQGRGYVPVEAREEEDRTEIGRIAVDAIFTPIREVGYHVESVRVGQRTDFDKVIMDIQTDGTVTPEEAIRQSAQILMDHFQLCLPQG